MNERMSALIKKGVGGQVVAMAIVVDLDTRKLGYHKQHVVLCESVLY